MAREVIDELSLKIDINTRKGTAKTVTAIADAITTLNKSVRNVGALERYVNTLNKLMKPMTRVPKNTAVGKVVKPETEEVEEPKAVDTKIATDNFKEVEKAFNPLKATYEEWAKSANKVSDSLVKNADGAKVLRQEFTYINEEGKKYKAIAINGELQKTSKAVKDAGKNANKSSSSFKKLVRSIGRIAFYRTIRKLISETVQSIGDGLGNLRKTDKVLDKSLKQLSQSQTSFNNSLASLIAPLIKTVEPFITKMTDGLARITNKIAEARAALKGETTYTKILTSDTKEWNEQLKEAQGYLLSFDKFEVLNTEEEGYTGTIEAEVTMDTGDAQKVIDDLNQINDIVIAIGVSLAALTLVKFAKEVGGIITLFKSLATSIGKVTAIAAGLFGIVAGIFSVIQGWKDIMDWDSETTGLQKLADVARVLFGTLAAVAGVMAIIKSGTVVGGIAAAIAVVAAIGSIVAGVGSEQEKLKAYADGGMVPKGTAFVAGEAGAEIVHHGSSGTGVANVEQIRQAQYLATMDAIQDSGLVDALRNVGGDVVIDGRKCGQVVTKYVHDEGVRVGYFKKA